MIQPVGEPLHPRPAVGGFLQDSWSIMDKVTLNAGLRYDTQSMYGTGGDLAFELGNQLSPRVGLIYDFTHRAAPSSTPASRATTRSGAGHGGLAVLQHHPHPGHAPPRARRATRPGAIRSPRRRRTRSAATTGNVIGSTSANLLSPKYSQTFAINSPVDPDLKPQSSDEYVVGGEYEVFGRHPRRPTRTAT